MQNTDVSEEESIKERYFDTLVSDTLDEISPSKLDEVANGDIGSVLNTSLEMFAQQVKEADGDKEIEKAYYDAKAENVRTLEAERGQIRDMLANLDIPATMENIEAALNYIENSYNPLKESYKRKDVLDSEKQTEFEELTDSMSEVLDSEESIQEKCKQAEKYMEDILNRSYEQPDIRYEDLDSLRSLSKGINLSMLMAERRSYDIPIKTGDTITNMNVTIIPSDDDNGKVKVSIRGNSSDEDNVLRLGDVTAEIKVVGESVKGYVLAGERQGYELLKESSDKLTKALETAGFEVKNISYGMNRVSQTDGFMAGKSDADTSALYKAAKIITAHLVSVSKQ